MMTGTVISYAVLWAILPFFTFINLSYMLHGGPKSDFAIAFALFAMPVISLTSRTSVMRQGVALLTDFENALETPVFDSPRV
jgi:hypothetical protein